MSFTIPPGPLAPVIRLDDFRADVRADPPPEPEPLWEEVEATARLFGSLRSAGMSVRFHAGDGDGPPRVTITDLQGRVLREVPPAVACDPVALEAELLGRTG